MQGIQESYRGWNAFRFSHGPLSFAALPELGGRIISLQFKGIELLFTQKEHEGETFSFSNSIDNIKKEKESMGFRLWGGDKIWIAPQSAWLSGIPPLDMDAGRYEHKITETGIIMTSPVCRETGLQIERNIILDREGFLHLEDAVSNQNDRNFRGGIWNVTQFLKPASVILPCSAEEVHACENEGNSEGLKGAVLLGSGDTKSGKESTLLCESDDHFKYGAMIPSVSVRFRQSARNIVHRRSFDFDAGAPYAHNASVEVYNSPSYNYFELEVHGKEVNLAGGEKASLKQRWEFKEISE